MINGKRVVVVMPAYDAQHTLEATVRELPEAIDECILVDDQISPKRAPASSINFRRSCIYGLGVLKTSIQFRLAKWGLFEFRIFNFPARFLERPAEPITLAERQ